MAASIQQKHFERAAKRSARNAVIRSGIVIALMAASMTIWLTQPTDMESVRPVVLGIESAVVGFCLWRILVAIGRLRDVTKHPYFRDFAVYGNPRELAAEVEAKIAGGSAIVEDSVIITDRFCVQLGIAHAVARLDDIAWMYVKQTKYKVNFIPVGTIRTIELFTFSKARRWVSIELSINERILQVLTERASRARIGHSRENEKWWKATRLSLEEKEKRVLVA